MIRLLVCGGRTYGRLADDEFKTPENLARIAQEKHDLYAAIEAECNWSPPDNFGNTMPCDTVIIQGDANGADRLAADWAVINWVPMEVFTPDWGTYGKMAGVIRNINMLKRGKPTKVIAAKGGRGTAHMVSIANKVGVPVIKVGW